MIFIQVEFGSGRGQYIIPPKMLDALTEDIRAAVDEGEAGMGWRVRLIEMTEEAYGALPEFQGF